MLLSRRAKKKLIEKGFVILTFLFFTKSILPIVKELEVFTPNQVYAITRVIFLGINVGIIFLILLWRKEVVCIVIKEKLLWALVGIALLSMLWSAAPENT